MNPFLTSPPDLSLLGRGSYYGLTAPLTAGIGIGKGVANLLGENELPETNPEYTGDILPAHSTAGRVIDVAGHLLPVGLEIAATGNLLSPITAGLPPLAARIATEAGGFGVVGGEQDQLTGLEQTGEGAAYGALSALPRGMRLIPAAALAVGSKMFFDRNGEEEVAAGLSHGDLAGMAGFAASMLPGKAHLPLPDHFAPPALEAGSEGGLATIAKKFGPEDVTTQALPTPINTPQYREFMMNRGNAELRDQTLERFTVPGREVPLQNAPGAQPPFLPPLANYPASESIDAIIEGGLPKRAPELSLPVGEPLSNPAYASGNFMEAKLAEHEARVEAKFQSQRDRAMMQGGETVSEPRLQPTMEGGGLRKLPAKNQSEGGSIDLSNPVNRAMLGGAVGGTIGALAEPEDNHGLMIGSLIGAGVAGLGPKLLRSLQEFKQQTGSNNLIKAVGQTLYDGNAAVTQAKLAKLDGRATFLDRTVARMDDWFRGSRPESLKRVLEQSRGLARQHLTALDDSLQKMNLGFHPSDTLKKDTMEFLEGKVDEATYLQSLQNSTAADQAYGSFAVNARDALDGLIETAANGVGSKSRADMMLNSRGEYLKQSYKLFSGKYTPSEQHVNELADKIITDGSWGTTSKDSVVQGLRQYAQEVQTSKGAYRAFKGSNVAATVDQSVFRHRDQNLAQEWKNFLGEVTDPAERVQLTLLKLKPMAEAGTFMSKVVNGLKDDAGNPMVFADRAALENAQRAAPDNAELKLYRYVPEDYRFGELKGKLVNRHVADVMDDWQTATQFDSSHTRWITDLNKLMKANVTYRNPAATARQFIGSPFFAMIARANPGHFVESLAGVRDLQNGLGKEMVQNGIVGADMVSAELGDFAKVNSMDAGKALFGRMDSSILNGIGKFRTLDKKAANLFRYPDMMVRANAYVSAKYRLAKELGLPLNSEEVINKAVEHTNKYTMNYELAPPGIKWARNVPGMNMFITYAAEITRLTKNLVVDVVKGSPSERAHALLTLGTLAALPETIQAASESALSDKDKADWEKVKAGLPTTTKYRYKAVTGRDKNGNFNYLDFSSVVPTDNFGQMARAMIQGNVTDAAQLNPVVGLTNSPAFNIVASQIAGRDLHTMREFRGASDRFASGAKEIFGPITPKEGSLWRAAVQGFSVNASGEQGLTDKQGRKLTPTDFFSRLGGIGSGQYSLSQIQRSQIAEAKSDVANELAWLKDIVGSDVPTPQKEAAALRTKAAIEQIQRQLQDHLDIK